MYEKKQITQKKAASNSFAGFLFIFIILLSSVALSQNIPAQPWTIPSRTYLKLAVTKAGFYSVTGQELRAAGLSTDKIKPGSIQIFRREKELAIEVLNKSQDQLHDQDMIRFYAEGNDGVSDSVLYVYPKAMPFGSYPLYSDTASYFFTWHNDGQLGKRISPTLSHSITDTLDYHLEEKEIVFNSHYNTGAFYPTGTGFNDGMAITAYDVGEGWTGPLLRNTWQNIDINTTNLRRDLIEKCTIQITVVGRAAGQNRLEIFTGTSQNPGRKLATISLTDYQPQTLLLQLQKEDLDKAITTGNKLSITVHADSGTSSISYIKWRFPQQAQLPATDEIKSLHFNTNTQNRFLKTGNTSGWKFYDITDPFNSQTVVSSPIGMPISGAQHIIAVRQYQKVNHISPVNLLQPEIISADYIILTHPDVRKAKDGSDPVKAYATYRSSVEGGGYAAAILNIQDVYDHYNGGEAGPAGIRKMIEHLSGSGKLKFLMIIGRAADPQTSRKTIDLKRKNMIPNAGWPGSDLALAMQIDSFLPNVPVVAVGRINANTAEEVDIYLRKVKQMEAEAPSAPWRKRVLHVSGGRTYKEIDTFSSYMNTFSKNLNTSYLAARVESKTKTTEEPVEYVPIEESLNKGVALVTLFGHSGIDVTDVDIGYVSDETRAYRNKPYYPAVIANGCASGSIFYSDKTISSDWIFTPDRGAVLFLAHTFNGSSTALKNYTASIYEVLADSIFTSQPFGIIQREAIRRNLKSHHTLSDLTTSQQMNLHGDPAIRIFPATLPDYAFDSSASSISDQNHGNISTWSDSLDIRLVINNHGRFSGQPYQLAISDATNQVLHIEARHAVALADTVSIRIKNPLSRSANLYLHATIDPDNQLQEESKRNNHLQIIQSIPQGGAFPLLPVSGFKTNQRRIDLIAQVPADIQVKELVFEWDSTSKYHSAQKQTVPVEQSLARFQLLIPHGYSNVYWRVYIPAYPDRPSVSHQILFNPGHIESLSLPEGIAFANRDQKVRLLEGDSIRCKAMFQNITNIPFTDSLLVKVTHSSPTGTAISFQKVAAAEPYTNVSFSLAIPTTGTAGNHRITILFNADSLPELLNHNNEVHFSFSVTPDQTPPLLFVTFDDRIITNGEETSASPVIRITLHDENPFLIMTDTTGLSVYLKEDCLQCSEKRIGLQDAVVRSGLPNQLSVTLNKLPVLTPGNYVLRVTGHDRSNNRTPEYQIRFKVSETALVKSVQIAPNPSHTYVRFRVTSLGSFPAQQMNITISDIYGRIIAQQLHLLHSGISEMIWEPADLPSGIYFYKLEISSGKTAISFAPDVNRSGKLILMR
jgi:hypothetical protein